MLVSYEENEKYPDIDLHPAEIGDDARKIVDVPPALYAKFRATKLAYEAVEDEVQKIVDAHEASLREEDAALEAELKAAMKKVMDKFEERKIPWQI